MGLLMDCSAVFDPSAAEQHFCKGAGKNLIEVYAPYARSRSANSRSYPSLNVRMFGKGVDDVVQSRFQSQYIAVMLTAHT